MSAESLTLPIPDFSEARELKKGYRDHPIGSDHFLYDEELVHIGDYGLAGQAYYSRPNSATEEPVAGVPKELFVRKTVAEKLEQINTWLSAPHVRKFFGREVELYIEDAHRSYTLQAHLRSEIFPALIRRNHPDITDTELQRRLNNLIAEPTRDERSPSPHATGGAVDVILRYTQENKGYVEDCDVYMGNEDGETSEIVFPDFYEHGVPDGKKERIAQMNRRAFYAIMTGRAFGADTELAVNPTEIWHWSYGDQMWAKMNGHPAALYGLID